MEEQLIELIQKVDELAATLSNRNNAYSIFLPFISALIGALFSAVLFHNLAMRRERRQQIYQHTQEIVNQFFSKEFIGHRVALWAMRSAVLEKKASIRFIAYGYIYPIKNKAYDGSQIDGLTEHQHLTLFFGFIERLGLYIRNKQIDRGMVKAALSYEMLWKADLIRAIAEEIRAIARETSSQEPTLVNNVLLVLDTLEITKERDQINPSHFPLKEFEINSP